MTLADFVEIMVHVHASQCPCLHSATEDTARLNMFLFLYTVSAENLALGVLPVGVDDTNTLLPSHSDLNQLHYLSSGAPQSHIRSYSYRSHPSKPMDDLSNRKLAYTNRGELTDIRNTNNSGLHGETIRESLRYLHWHGKPIDTVEETPMEC
jgi:hypothetical protein